MQAIETKFLGANDNNGPRLSVRCDAKRITVPWDHNLGAPANHVAAARKLADQMEWTGQIISGSLPSGNYAHVFAVPNPARPQLVKVTINDSNHGATVVRMWRMQVAGHTVDFNHLGRIDYVDATPKRLCSVNVDWLQMRLNEVLAEVLATDTPDENVTL